jgi:sugar transferase (PEP-CTERM/EpsH1 system associated)
LRNLLFLSQRIPYPPNKGDKIRSYHILKHLAKSHRVYVGCFIDDAADEKYIPALRAECAELNCLHIGRWERTFRSAKGLLTGASISEAVFSDRRMSRWIKKTISKFCIDDIYVFCSSMAPYVMTVAGRKIIDIVDVDSEKWRAYSLSSEWPLRAIYAREQRTLFSLERRAALEFGQALFVSKAEAEMFIRLAPETAANVQYMSNGVDADYFDPAKSYCSPFAPGKSPIVFTGMMNYHPNVEATRWFALDIFPLLREVLPAAEFWIVGAQPSASVLELAKLPGVHVTGQVIDVRPYLAHSKCVVAPLKLARGVQNKILEALAMAKPVVATPQAAEGISAQPGKEILLASDEREFALMVFAAASGTYPDIGTNGRKRIEEDYRWERSLALLDDLFLPQNEHQHQ